ncbi:hypothetical protein SAMN04488028_107130 [Reichenbachiella agariperforans]|uniref:Teicoplanin resistance protein VanZ n=1 Tax=Reichenbachiella agariperforans TaxID=156994 RepID=A0A1M6UID1_REIAG|nr:hypothetical protein [Reichenbachiella agariperforans]SHK68920.1 hypothetical protein SAMN04488028_107130 [Reichenbachiella agariperforans]
MDADIVKLKNSQNIVPVNIANKETYYSDLSNIENSWTGRMDAQISNTFFHEAIQLIINSIDLFERGIFDCAFYSLRQALEVSMTLTYLIEGTEEKKEVELSKWKEQGHFPMYGAMVKALEKDQSVYADIKDCMKDYFSELESSKKKLNKYVHKQGFSTFYVSKNHAFNQSKSRDKFVEEFEGHLKKCIGAVAVLRLTVDPFPILLMDEEIYRRTGDMMTFQYNEDFVEKYIGKSNIESYKKTEFYSTMYDSFMQDEAKSDEVANVVKDQFIDKSKVDEILKQKHLLSHHDLAAVFLASFSDKVAKIYSIGGMHMYFTTTKSKRDSWSYSGLDFKQFKESKNPFNMKYDEAFISCVDFLGDTNFIEHNFIFSKKEIIELEELVNTHNRVDG